MKGDLAAGGITALAGGIAAAVALNHLPAVVVVLLSVAIAAITFAITQAITFREAEGKGVKWLSLAISLAAVTAAGGFIYHEELDPATKPPALPFTIVESVDPPNPVIPEECRQVVVPGPWRAPASPGTATQQAINQWERAEHGVDATGTYVTIILQGASSHAVTIDAPGVAVVARRRPLSGSVAEMSSGGCGAQIAVRQFTVDLDQAQPVANFQKGTGLPGLPSAGGTIKQAQSPVFTISDTDPEYFVVYAATRKNLVRWYLHLNWQSMGKSGTVTIGNGSAPLATSAVNPARQAFYFLQPNGDWSKSR